MSKDTKPFSFITFTDNSQKHGGSAVYGLGFIGSILYFLQATDSFWDGLAGIFQALVWPAYIAYTLLESFYGVV